MRKRVPADELRGYDDLSRRYTEGVDFAVHVRARDRARVAVVAPHGGRIEGGTSEVSRLIAGDDHSLYLFEGLRTTNDNFHLLHLASHCFDEPRCLGLVAGCETVVTVHGYAAPGPDVLLGGRDEHLKQEIARELASAGVSVLAEGHRYPGRDPQNICNRGRRGAGVQLELSDRLRLARDWMDLARAVRAVLARAPWHGAAGGRIIPGRLESMTGKEDP